MRLPWIGWHTSVSAPAAVVVHLLFYMDRHFVVAEYNSEIMSSHLWRKTLHWMPDSFVLALKKERGGSDGKDASLRQRHAS